MLVDIQAKKRIHSFNRSLDCAASVSSEQKAIFRFLATREIGGASRHPSTPPPPPPQKKGARSISRAAGNRKLAFRSLEMLASYAGVSFSHSELRLTLICSWFFDQPGVTSMPSITLCVVIRSGSITAKVLGMKFVTKVRRM